MVLLVQEDSNGSFHSVTSYAYAMKVTDTALLQFVSLVSESW